MIHQYKLGGYNIVLDVSSGAVHVVDDIAYDMIALFETTERADVIAAMAEKYGHLPEVSDGDLEECYDQLLELKESGQLFVPDTFESMAPYLKEKTSGVVKALCLHIAHTCNLN